MDRWLRASGETQLRTVSFRPNRPPQHVFPCPRPVAQSWPGDDIDRGSPSRLQKSRYFCSLMNSPRCKIKIYVHPGFSPAVPVCLSRCKRPGRRPGNAKGSDGAADILPDGAGVSGSRNGGSAPEPGTQNSVNRTAPTAPGNGWRTIWKVFGWETGRTGWRSWI